jgi:hypothetical protein
MVQIIIKEEHLLRGMNKGLMALLHIGVEKKNFGNWWSIFLLNVFHKILAKAL